MKNMYAFHCKSILLKPEVVRIEITVKKNDEIPYICGRLQMSPEVWDAFEALLRFGVSIFGGARLQIDNTDNVLKAIAQFKGE